MSTIRGLASPPGGVDEPTPGSAPDEADETGKAPLPDDQMNLIRQIFSGDGSG